MSVKVFSKNILKNKENLQHRNELVILIGLNTTISGREIARILGINEEVVMKILNP